MDSLSLANRVRRHTVDMVHRGKSSHVGSALSMVDILSVLYSGVLNVSPETINSPDRDYFVLSKGHGGASLYATLAECGFFPLEDLKKHYQNGSPFSGHVSHKGILGVEFSTGSLGHGLPVAAGLALASKIDERNNQTVVLVGDGEVMEGANWEALLFAAHHKLDNLTIIVDRNRLQSFKDTEQTVALDPLDKKFEAFGAYCIEVDGHDHSALLSAIDSKLSGKPKVIIANTIKGKGVSYMENEVVWHYKFPDEEQLKIAHDDIARGSKL
ncbi:transketolase [Enterovibrio baiacu]|uniref:transketolase n=1 Tax=Enterovibrio baiacu TaxID=2491023 RepID=UPI00101177C2|nr:transketolase [Enterovibrio baiacu]MBE1274797.1 transketolase [Enterovibrio baiacu]